MENIYFTDHNNYFYDFFRRGEITFAQDKEITLHFFDGEDELYTFSHGNGRGILKELVGDDIFWLSPIWQPESRMSEQTPDLK